MCCWMVCFENLIESQKSVKDPLETRLWKPKFSRAGSSSAVVSMSAINCLLKVKQRLSTHCKELYCPLIKHSVHAAVMWSFFWQTWRLFKVFCRTILAMVRNFPWIIHLTAGDAAVKNSSLGRKEIKMGREKNNNKPRKWGKWKEFEWKKHVQRKCAKECAQEKQHFSAFSLQFFPSVNCTHSGEGKQKAIYAAQYQIALSWRGPSPSESVSVWEGGDACKSACNRKSTEQSDFFLIRKETKYQTPFRMFSCCVF